MVKKSAKECIGRDSPKKESFLEEGGAGGGAVFLKKGSSPGFSPLPKTFSK
jgi:hypothetical protein